MQLAMWFKITISMTLHRANYVTHYTKYEQIDGESYQAVVIEITSEVCMTHSVVVQYVLRILWMTQHHLTTLTTATKITLATINTNQSKLPSFDHSFFL